MKIAVIVQRYGEDVVGGAELHARWITQRLARQHDVEVLTTCARDYLTWENVYEPGPAEVGGVKVLRFPVARRRTPAGYDPLSARVHFGDHDDEDERRWMDEHGPVTPGLIKHLRRHRDDYGALVFFSYRYWTSYHGLQVAPDKSILVPTAEEDPTVRLRIFREFFRQPAQYAFNSPEEKDLLVRASGASDLPGEVVGVGIEDAPAVPADDIRRRLDITGDYVVYVGRIEREKGCARLFDHFARYVQDRSAHLNLLLVGRPVLPIPEHVNIRHLGVISDADKLAVIAASRLLVHPSLYESLSMALLEAWKMGRPALVNATCAVLRGQVQRANGGLYYRNYEEFAECLSWLLDHREVAEALGRSGREYYVQNYGWDTVMSKYDRLLAALSAGARS